MNNKFSLCRLAFVATLLVTKVARGQQQDFEQCGRTFDTACDGRSLLVRGKRYINCSPTPFVDEEGQNDEENLPPPPPGQLDGQITLPNIANDVTALNGNPSDVTVVSFPCVTTSSQSVDLNNLLNDNPATPSDFLPNLARVRFANWATGPENVFYVRYMPALKRIYAPRLEGTSNLNVLIEANLKLTKVISPLLESAGDVRIYQNPELVKFKLPALTTVQQTFQIRDNLKLTKVISPLLKTAAVVDISFNENLANIDLSALTTGSGPTAVFFIRGNSKPVKVSFSDVFLE
ncbi:hypothetical protein NFJ02_08g135710 [Pycnococcus provasolii]